MNLCNVWNYEGLQGWIDCFEKARFADVIRGVGINNIGGPINMILQ